MCIAYVDPGNLEADLQVGACGAGRCAAACCSRPTGCCFCCRSTRAPVPSPSLPPSLQTGATTGYSLLWVLLWSTAMGYLLQSLAARL